MTLRHAIIEATVPASPGVVNYTAPGLSNWSGGGLALLFVSGDTGAPTFGGFLTVGMVDSGGGQSCTAWNAVDNAQTIPENKEANVSDHAVVILDNTTGTAFASIARAQFSSSLSNGVALNWTSVSGVGSRVFKIVLVLIEGFAGVAAMNNAATAFGFQADGCLHVPCGNGAFGTWPPGARSDQEVCPGLGGVTRSGSPPQKAAYVISDRTADPLVSRGGRRTANWAASSNGSIEHTGTVTAFTATGLSTSGTSRGMFAAMKSAGPSDYGFAIETLDGSTGTKVFTSLGARFGLIVGFVCGVTSDDTFEANSSALATFAYFVTDGVTTISMGFAQRHNGTAISGANPTDTYSSYSGSSILMVDHLNATDFAATVAPGSPTASGLNLAVTNGLSGTLFLFGFATAPVVETPTGVSLPLVLPAPTIVIAHAQMPDPVHLPLVLPSPIVTASHQPTPVVLALVIRPATVFAPLIPAPTPPPPDLGPSYAESLALLLPRGLAWAKRTQG